MRAFVVLGLVFSIPSHEIGLRKRLRNDLFCVEWDVKRQLSQPIELMSMTDLLCLCVQYVTHEMYDDALKDLQDDNEIVRTGNNIRRTT